MQDKYAKIQPGAIVANGVVDYTVISRDGLWLKLNQLKGDKHA